MGNNVKEKTSPKLMLSYSLGEIGCQMSWYMVNSYLMLFYTDIEGLAAGAISMIMLIARVWDAINDPMMGNICDRTNTKWGKFRPYLYFAPPFLAIFNILCISSIGCSKSNFMSDYICRYRYGLHSLLYFLSSIAACDCY